MAILLDTNILLLVSQPHVPHSPIAERALDVLRGRNETLLIASQNIVEFWAVATRPATENGLGFTVDHAMRQVLALKRLFTLLPEQPLQSEWERLVATYRVAAMTVHGTRTVLTFNVQDFTRYAEITVLDPRTVV